MNKRKGIPRKSMKMKSEISFFSPEPVQKKLPITQPNDKLEKEADQISMQMLSQMGKGSRTRSNIEQSKDFKICRKDDREIIPINHTYSNSVKTALESPGDFLEIGVRKDMEAHFGEDFSNVRIHKNETANRGADAINAKAYTFHNDIVFGKNQYNPQTFEGKKLLAHELVHILQQNGKNDPKHGSPQNKLSFISPSIQRATKTFVEGGIRGHASPGWKRTRGSTAEELNLTLSRERAANVEYLFQEMFRRAMAGHGEIEFAITSSIEERDPGIVAIPSEGVGHRETIVESGGNPDADDRSMRRVDINIVVTRQIEGMTGYTESVVVPEECQENATNQWSIKLAIGGGAGHAGIGGAFAVGRLKNRRTGQIADGSFIGGGIGVGLQTPGVDPGWGDWSDFTTDDICTFNDFDNTLARLTTAGAALFVGYSLAWISFPMRGANSIYVGGFNAGALGIDAGSNVGNWNVHGTPPGPICTPEHTVAREGLAPFQYDIQDGLRHTVFFDTGSAEIDDTEFQRLDEFVQHITARYSEE